MLGFRELGVVDGVVVERADDPVDQRPEQAGGLRPVICSFSKALRT